MKCKSFFVDSWTDHSEKSWKVHLGSTFTYLAKSQCSQGIEPNEFIAPAWLVNKIIHAADRKLIKAA